MQLYNSYIKKTKSGEIEDLIFVKNGFSFPAFIFSLGWFAYKKMIFVATAILIILLGLIDVTSYYLDNKVAGTILAILSTLLIIGVNANYWYSKFLKKRGYNFIGCIFGKSKEEAKLRFVEACYLDKDAKQAIDEYKILDKRDQEILAEKLKKKTPKTT